MLHDPGVGLYFPLLLAACRPRVWSCSTSSLLLQQVVQPALRLRDRKRKSRRPSKTMKSAWPGFLIRPARFVIGMPKWIQECRSCRYGNKQSYVGSLPKCVRYARMINHACVCVVWASARFANDVLSGYFSSSRHVNVTVHVSFGMTFNGHFITTYTLIVLTSLTVTALYKKKKVHIFSIYKQFWSTNQNLCVCERERVH